MNHRITPVYNTSAAYTGPGKYSKYVYQNLQIYIDLEIHVVESR